jgi:predicted glycoside hydrolase/deacetylase ChbG (UPF0249 family)
MVNMAATEEAVGTAATLPDLSVGLHVNFTNEGDDPVVDVADAEACQTELAHQYQQFKELMGKKPTHIDSQHNVHRFPHLWPLFVDLALSERLPLRGDSPARYFGNFYGQWDGETHLEHLSVDNLKHMITTETRTRVTELACHPGYVDPAFETIYNEEREAELEALCDQSLPEFLDRLGVELISFRDLAVVSDVRHGEPGEQ